MKLNKIALQNFRAFHSFEDKLKFNNRSVLIYGENGSGKSSIFWALHAFVHYYNNEAKSKAYFTQNDEKSLLNIFNTTEDGFIKITFDDDVEYTYDQTGITPGIQTQLTNLSRVKSFLTYKDLLGLDMMHSYENELFAKKILLELLTGDIVLKDAAGENLGTQDRLERIELLLHHPLEITYYKNVEDARSRLSADIENLDFLYSVDVGEFELTDREGDVTGLDFYAISQTSFEQLKALDYKVKSFIEHYDSIFQKDATRQDFIDNWEGSISEIEPYVEGTEAFNEKAEMYRNVDTDSGSAALDTYIDNIETTLSDFEDSIYDDNFSIKFDSIFSTSDTVERLYSDWKEVRDAIDAKIHHINTNPTKRINALLEKLGYDNIDVSISVDYGKTKILDFYVEYNSEPVKHHKFLNEAKLSAINLAFYFSAILSYTKPDIPILILDDLLISLDMGNRSKVLELITDQTLFTDYQLFVLTHERSFYDMAKSKLSYIQNEKWINYEMYIDDSGDIDDEKPYIKKGRTYLERANVEFLAKNYDCASNLLRKACEGHLERLLPQDKKVSNTCEKLQLNDLLQNAHNIATGSDKALLATLQTYRTSIFNPQSHNDDVEVYKNELKSAIEAVKSLSDISNLEA
jgi:energy-coupling factor transporter ATP-binding protein EcfA2